MTSVLCMGEGGLYAGSPVVHPCSTGGITTAARRVFSLDEVLLIILYCSYARRTSIDESRQEA